MSYKTVVTVYRDPASDAAHLEAAIAFARAEGAHLHVLALGIERVPPEAFYGGASVASLHGTVSLAIEEADAAEQAAKARTDRSDITCDVQRIVAQIGAVSQIIARYASLSDLVILPQPYGNQRSAEDVAILEAALFSTRTPVLVVPPGMTEIPVPKRVVIAWNQSPEALSAIRAAMPILKTADLAEVLIVNPPKHNADYADPGTQLAEMLTRHGITVDVSVIAQTMPKVSETIDRYLTDQAGDMVVMGAYGHSRLREAILGGTTRNMLENASVPVLMAH